MALALSAGSSARAVLQAALLAPRPARGYAASAASGAMRRAAAAEDACRDAAAAAKAEVSWVPDPVTGHYRPSNWAAAAAVDPADLRAAHLTSTYARA